MPDYDVAVVGMGPVGCTAALLFAEAGLSVAAIERDEEVYRLPLVPISRGARDKLASVLSGLGLLEGDTASKG